MNVNVYLYLHPYMQAGSSGAQFFGLPSSSVEVSGYARHVIDAGRVGLPSLRVLSAPRREKWSHQLLKVPQTYMNG